jgi:hypothetical protein
MMWSADPHKLRALAVTLAGGCAARGGALVTCPGGATLDEGAGPRAGFQEIGGVWRMTWFIAGP